MGVPQIAPPSPHAQSSIMVIDDNDDLRQSVTRLLRGAGYDVRLARNGREALDQLEHATAPDLFLLDLMMPQMDGWEFRLEQRKRPRLAEVPVVVLSADRSSKARAIDADAYLHKPLEPKSLLMAVEMRLLTAERRKLEHRTAQLDRLGSMSVLAAGIAHEINNPLAVVAGNVELSIQLLTQLSEGQAALSPAALRRALSLLKDARAGTGRIAHVVHSVGTFSHPQDTGTSVVNVSDVLASSIRLVANELRHRARLICEIDARLPVLGNTAQLGQVFINLLTNAVRAIAEGNPAGNAIRIVGARTAEGRTLVEISDTGCGIAPENLTRVFDPFFTTNAVGEGMGLGLAVSQRLVAAAGGVITVQSTLSEGTSFRVDLPSYVEPEAVSVAAAAAVALSPQLGVQRPRVMVIDDEPLMCELLVNMLEDDHEVTSFCTPREALETLRADPHWDVVLSDVMMPELSGMDLYAEIVRDQPALATRFLFMTGGTFTARAHAFLQSLPQPALHKPLARDVVVQRIAETTRRERPVTHPAQQVGEDVRMTSGSAK